MGLSRDGFAVLNNVNAVELVGADNARHSLLIFTPAVNAVTISNRPGVVAGNGPTIRAGQSPVKLTED